MKGILCFLGLCAALRGGDAQLLEAIRNGDAAQVRAMLKSGADPNQGYASGATALMHAAGFAAAECVGILLEAGADVNGFAGNGATALMWGTGDSATVRLLLEGRRRCRHEDEGWHYCPGDRRSPWEYR